MNKKILILGGGVAGCSIAYFLNKKGYKTTIIEKLGTDVGGLSRTYYYSNHPYEFGPHIWFYQNSSPVNDVIRELTNNELYHIDRRLLSFVEKDNQAYRYPIHFDDIKYMPDKKNILKFLSIHRDKDLKLIIKELPIIGKCTFADYFKAVIGKPLFDKFMKNYTHKMWNIDPKELQTSMVWADRVKHTKNNDSYDPLKFEDYTLGKEVDFQVYPKKGWNQVWDKMVKGSKIIKGKIIQIYDDFIFYDGGHIKISDYNSIVNTLGLDHLFSSIDTNYILPFPYTGRMIIPVLFPYESKYNPPGVCNTSLFPMRAESIHYPGTEFQTRVTDIDVITHYESKNGRLLLVEIPIESNIDEKSFPQNVIENAKKNNLFAKNCYAKQTTKALESYNNILNIVKKRWPMILHCGRQAEFRYIGMPETVESAYNLIEDNF